MQRETVGKSRAGEPWDRPERLRRRPQTAGGEDGGQLLWPEERSPGRRRDAAMWRLDRLGRGRAENGPQAGQAACPLPAPAYAAFLGCRWRAAPAPASPGQREGAELPGHLAQRPRSGVWRLPSLAVCLPSVCCLSPAHVPAHNVHGSASFPPDTPWEPRALRPAHPLRAV